MLAGIAWIAGASLGLMPSAVEWLSDQLASAFVGWPRMPGLELWFGAALLGLVCLLAIAVVIAAPRARARRALAADPNGETIPAGPVVALIVAAAIVITLACIDTLAGAARSVDASTSALTTAWLTGVRRGLFALAGAAAGVGVIERLVSARRIWRGLHQTPAQARREARAGRGRTRS